MLDKIKREPAVLLIVAAAVIAFGVDLAVLSETVEKLLQLLTLAGAAAGVRSQVTSKYHPRDDDGTPLVRVDDR